MTQIYYMPVVLSKTLTKKINLDLSSLVQWLQANKIASNVNKNEPFEWSKNEMKNLH